MRRMFCKFCLQGPLGISKRYLPVFFKWFILQNGKCYKVFLVWMQSSVLYCEKAYNYLNIKGNFLDIYFQIALMVGQRCSWMGFATMSFLSLPQSKGVFLWLAHDPVINGYSLPYHMYNTECGYQISLRLVYLNHMQYIWMKKKGKNKRPQYTKGLPKKKSTTNIEVAGSATLCGLTLKCGVARLHAKYNNFCQTVN